MSHTYRKSLSSFNRFAPWIGKALEQWPKPYVVAVPKATGVLQPIRDAIKAKRDNGYEHPLVDNTLFKMHSPFLCVYEGKTESLVCIGPRPVRNKALPGVEVNGEAEASFELTDVTSGSIDDLCRMVGSQSFKPMPRFLVRNIDINVRSILQDRYQVAFVPVEGQEETYQIV